MYRNFGYGRISILDQSSGSKNILNLTLYYMERESLYIYIYIYIYIYCVIYVFSP